MIDSYSFGRMTIGGAVYARDLIIYPDGRIQDSWWRREGHYLQFDDLAEVLAVQPDIIVAGTGAAGIMKPAVDLAETLEEQGIRLIARPTADACTTFNDLQRQGEKVAGCFHLTC